ncbi:MAG: hypothetical protein Q9200_007619, partial [Gallowayella weberi]
MDAIFNVFHHAQYSHDGPVLGALLSPIPPIQDPTLLHRFHEDSNVFSIQSDITNYIKIPHSSVPKGEANAWIDIYVAYWKAIGEILRAETGHHRHDWAIKVYEAWKEVMNLVIRGYSGSAGFAAWTLPVLYMAGKYLRVFAIKADEEQAAKMGNGVMNMEADGIGDDVTSGAFEKNERLEDAARVINRLNSISLSKNCLRALQASAIDMPPMSQFPKAHIVTFKYYVGVIHFLDEEYHKNKNRIYEPQTNNPISPTHRPKKTSQPPTDYATKTPTQTK